VAVSSEAGIGSELSRADLKPQLLRRPIALHTALTDIRRAFGEGSDQREDRGPDFAHAAVCTTPLEVEDVCGGLVDVGSDQRESRFTLTPRLDVRSEMDLGPFGDPARLTERRNQLACARDQPTGIADAIATLVVLPPSRHSLTLQHAPPTESAYALWPDSARLDFRARQGDRRCAKDACRAHRARCERSLPQIIDLVGSDPGQPP
jgi:hypothetical protein